jgi:beta-lactamase class A
MESISRRRVLTGGLAITAFTVAHPLRADARPAPDVGSSIVEAELRHQARIGLYAMDLKTKKTVEHRNHERFAMCSSVKTYVAARVLQKAERRELALTDSVVVHSADLLPNSPVTETRVGRSITVSELCAAALQQSDNAATNYLLKAVGGPPAITEFARSIGDNETRLDRWETELNSAIPGDVRDTSTPQALGDGNRALLEGTALTPQSRRELIEWMVANSTSSLRPGMPPDWILADKTGGGGYGTTNDVGLGFGPVVDRSCCRS